MAKPNYQHHNGVKNKISFCRIPACYSAKIPGNEIVYVYMCIYNTKQESENVRTRNENEMLQTHTHTRESDG